MVIAPDDLPYAPAEPSSTPAIRPPRRSFGLTFLGLMTVVLVVAGLTFAGYEFWKAVRPDDTGGTVGLDEGAGPSAQQAPLLVRGTVTAMHVEVARFQPIGMPLEITTPERGFGAGATFEGVVVDGQRGTIEWDAGRPLVITGEGGSLALDPGVIIDASAAGFVITLDGPVHSLTPGVYQITTPVAVGFEGIAQPVDSVTFEANAETTVTFRGTATVTVPVTPVTITANGGLAIDGTLTVSRGAEQDPATRVELDGGPSVLTITPQADGTLTVEATIEGDPTVT